MKATAAILTLTLLAGGIAVACEIFTEQFTVSVSVSVSDADIATAAAQGHHNPARAAAVANLDAQGIAQFGAYWQTNNFLAPVTYQF